MTTKPVIVQPLFDEYTCQEGDVYSLSWLAQPVVLYLGSATSDSKPVAEVYVCDTRDDTSPVFAYVPMDQLDFSSTPEIDPEIESMAAENEAMKQQMYQMKRLMSRMLDGINGLCVSLDGL